MWTIERAKVELEDFWGCCGAVRCEIMVVPAADDPTSAVLLIPERSTWERRITWEELVKELNTGNKLDYHTLGRLVSGHQG